MRCHPAMCFGMNSMKFESSLIRVIEQILDVDRQKKWCFGNICCIRNKICRSQIRDGSIGLTFRS